VLSKSLAAFGQPLVPVKDKQVNWKADVANKLVSLQKREDKTGLGFWKNDTDKYFEGDPVLVTAYSLLALEYAAK
jgi:squalene-hopene/tetraprenyl-beta-curcumene cyclase